ncbi:MAG: hypothetical protein JWO67_923 [Streptosporangiaceae bacterium]|nr:hypothetical protein [Streptosporangiaceae bacterium]
MTTEILHPVAQDMRDRWLPSETAVRHARALLDAEPAADLAVVPMLQPGKTHGIWTLGQEVETVPGVVFICINSFTNTAALPGYSWCRGAAAAVARDVLAGRDGTVGYANVSRDGHVAVFEDF